MQVTCPNCRALADRIYDPPFLRRTECSNCGYVFEEINAKEVQEMAKILGKMQEEHLAILMQKWEDYREKWLKDHKGICSPMWFRPIPKEKIPPDGYWRVPGTLREWLQVLGVKDIEAAEKVVRKSGPFNRWQENAFHLWRTGVI
ncbi:MAG: hypothetical protein A4E49_03156 [Methanosaeta sp. PtaU1.Bin112]|nr:MAG: hypothetical protein A4E49_03156 [Methanosaeta sp. PtaU1.Bin112]